MRVFSATGGIEKVCKIIGKALYEHNSTQAKIISMHDAKNDAVGNPYFSDEIFTAYQSQKIKFVLQAIRHGRKSNIVLLSHVNLLLVAWLIKIISPSTKIILIAHGIEVWQPLNQIKKQMLRACSKIISVSQYTQNKIIHTQKIPASKCIVLNNCIDPFLKKEIEKQKSQTLLNRYNIKNTDTVLLTLTRLSEKDRHKGYTNVIAALHTIIQTNPNVKYILAGGYTPTEFAFIQNVINKHSLQNNVIITGYINNNDLPSLFALADIYIMPSIKEGFGIVFIEAMYYGLVTIAGNTDGSVDAVLNGQLGLLVNPFSSTDIKQRNIYNNNTTSRHTNI